MPTLRILGAIPPHPHTSLSRGTSSSTGPTLPYHFIISGTSTVHFTSSVSVFSGNGKSYNYIFNFMNGITSVKILTLLVCHRFPNVNINLVISFAKSYRAPHWEVRRAVGTFYVISQYGLYNQGSITGGNWYFFSSPPPPDRLRSPPNRLYSGYRGLFSGG
jgi:hypothetical protein